MSARLEGRLPVYHRAPISGRCLSRNCEPHGPWFFLFLALPGAPFEMRTHLELHDATRANFADP